MEPILIILLLFGAFTLGAETADSQTTEPLATVSEQQVQERVVALNLQACLSGRHPVLYRDLTIPFTQQALPAPHESECPDE
jgi:hypothetical protein